MLNPWAQAKPGHKVSLSTQQPSLECGALDSPQVQCLCFGSCCVEFGRQELRTCRCEVVQVQVPSSREEILSRLNADASALGRGLWGMILQELPSRPGDTQCVKAAVRSKPTIARSRHGACNFMLYPYTNRFVREHIRTVAEETTRSKQELGSSTLPDRLQSLTLRRNFQQKVGGLELPNGLQSLILAGISAKGQVTWDCKTGFCFDVSLQI